MASTIVVWFYVFWIIGGGVVTNAKPKGNNCEESLCQASGNSSLLQGAIVNGRPQVQAFMQQPGSSSLGSCWLEEGWSKCEDAPVENSTTHAFAPANRINQMRMGGLASGSPDLKALEAPTSEHHCEWECKRIKVPSNYNDADGAKLEIYLRRARARRAKNQQLWMLQGGPGFTGEVLKRFLPLVGDWVSDYDVYIPDHRGVPFSTALRCHVMTQAYYESIGNLDTTCSSITPCAIPDAAWKDPSFASACIKELRQNGLVLQDFTVSNAARDVLYLMKQQQLEDAKASYNIYGISYGTMWGQRILEVSLTERLEHKWPKISRAILSGVVSSKSSFDHFPLGSNYAGRKLMEYCGADPLCSKHYGPGVNAWKGLVQKFEAISNKRTSCAADLLSKLGGDAAPSDTLSTFLYKSLVFGRQVETLDLVDMISASSSPARPFAVSATSIIPRTLTLDMDFRVWALIVMHRVARCDEMDKNVTRYFQAFDLLASVVGGSASVVGGRETDEAHSCANEQSQILYEQIVNTELLSARNGGKVPSVYESEKSDEIIFSHARQHDSDPWFYDPNTSSTSPWPTEGIWPYNYSYADAYSKRNVSTDASVLFIQGDLDGQTPYWSAKVAYDEILAPCKRLVGLPGWGHGGVFKTKCGFDALATFLGGAEDSCPALTCDTLANMDFAKGGGTESVLADAIFAPSGYWGDHAISESGGGGIGVASQFGLSESKLKAAIGHGMLQHET